MKRFSSIGGGGPVLVAPIAALGLFLALFAAFAHSADGTGDSHAGRAAQGRAPANFIGLSPQGQLERSDLRLIARAEVDTVRIPLNWYAVEPVAPGRAAPDWSTFDRIVALAAAEDIRVVPFVWGTPEWIASSPNIEPVDSPRALRRWSRFLRRAVGRYGPFGRFWTENPDLPQHPIQTWQIWNEPNIVTFSRTPDPNRYGRLITASASAVRSVDPAATVIMAGLFGRPLEIPPNISPAKFLSGVLRVDGAGEAIDAISLHPYLAFARAMPSRIKALRNVLDRNGQTGTSIWITELGWGSDQGESRWEKGLRGQMEELDEAIGTLTANRTRWNIGRVYWFSNVDAGNACQFCDSAGLITANFRAKPAWFAFNDWTGGDAGALSEFRSAKAVEQAPD